jgi:hypothetical protein
MRERCAALLTGRWQAPRPVRADKLPEGSMKGQKTGIFMCKRRKILLASKSLRGGSRG